MADTKISSLPLRADLTEADEIITVAGGANYRSPLSAVVGLVPDDGFTGLADGTKDDPAIAPASDPNTGIFFENGGIRFTVNGYDLWRMYASTKAGAPSGRMGTSDGTNTPWHIGVVMDNSRPKWNMNRGGATLGDGNDPADLTWYHKANDPDETPHEAVDPDQATRYGQVGFMAAIPYREWTDGTALAAGEFKTPRPIILQGAGPDFLSTRWFRTSSYPGNTGPPEHGERLHFACDVASGTTPRVSLDGVSGLIPLNRNDGATPATDFWTPGTNGWWEGTFTYNSSTSDLRADVDSGTNAGGAGRTVNVASATTPFYGRSHMLSWLYTSAPTSFSTGGMAVMSPCPEFEIANRYRQSWGPGPGTVFFGRTGHEDYIDALGRNGIDRYPGDLTLNDDGDLTDPNPNTADKTAAWAWGDRTPKNTPPFATAAFMATDYATLRYPAIAVRAGSNPSYGIDINYDATNHEAIINVTTPGTVPKSVNAVTNNGIGQYRITSTGHGLHDGQTVVGAGTDGGVLNGWWVIRKVDNHRFDLCGSRYLATALSPVGTFTPTIVTTALVITDDGRVTVPQGRVTFGDSTDGVWIANSASGELSARLADNTDFGVIRGKLATASNYVNTPVTPTGYIVLYDLAGVAYKIPAEAL